MRLEDVFIAYLEGGKLDWSQYMGKKILFVNVASECGYTPQYAELQGLFEEFGEKNFVVIGVPCNDFGAQEPGDAAQIAEFCDKRYGVTFPITEKVSILGDSRHPLYDFLTDFDGKDVAWNFQKYLVNEEGKVVAVFESGVSPFDEAILAHIEK